MALDVVSNSQLKVDISTGDPIAPSSARPGFPPLSRSSSFSPCPTQLPILSSHRSACSPNINSGRLCGIRNFPTVFSAQRRSIRAPNLRHHRETLSSPLSLTPSDLLPSSSAASFVSPIPLRNESMFFFGEGVKTEQLLPHSPLSLPLSSLSAAQYMRNRAGVCL